ncbi:hypothetical protein P879_06145 [Paragonimus westermani]|uniref:Uncharacterized protein n=1 Tax=Paragonimus westermani TaxID=34504 RepID=A0A8T0DH46_9TREM|nr:hypothetical protein P879_06145 [Paragonimus westermani]
MPPVRTVKARYPSSGAKREYEKLVSDLNAEIDRLSCQNRSLSENLSRTEEKIVSERKNERDLEKHNQSLLNELYQLNKENMTMKADFRKQMEMMENETNQLRTQLCEQMAKQEDTVAEINRMQRVSCGLLNRVFALCSSIQQVRMN